MDREAARQLALSQTIKTLKRAKLEPEEFLKDFCQHDDGAGNMIDDRLEVREMTGEESMQFSEEAKRSDRIAMGNLLVKVILMPGGSNEPLYNKEDREAVLKYGTSVLLPIQNKVLKLSGLEPPTNGTTPKDAAKNA
jgi:hypothetical protein